MKYPFDLSYFPFSRSGVVPSGFPSSSEQWYRRGSGRISRSGISFGSCELVQSGFSFENGESDARRAGTWEEEVMMQAWEPWKVKAPERDLTKEASWLTAWRGEVSMRSRESV